MWYLIYGFFDIRKKSNEENEYTEVLSIIFEKEAASRGMLKMAISSGRAGL